LIFTPLLAWSQNPDPQVCAQPDYTTGLFTCNGIDCPPEGAGARPILNRLKNRDILPVELQPLPFNVKDMVDWHRGEVLPYVWEHRSQLIGPDRAAWPPEALSEVQEWECQPVMAEGVLIQRNIERAELCNCSTSSQPCVDFHMFVAAPEYLVDEFGGDDPLCVSAYCRGLRLVVEVTPRTIAQHPEWTSALIQRLATARAYVRITGWRLWDPEHPSEVDRTRGSLWEIHPVHRIEVVAQDGTWVDLCPEWPACFAAALENPAGPSRLGNWLHPYGSGGERNRAIARASFAGRGR
jgi:hypothetical protein